LLRFGSAHYTLALRHQNRTVTRRYSHLDFSSRPYSELVGRSRFEREPASKSKLKRNGYMKLTASLLIIAACASSSFAADTVVRWQKIVGVITAPNVDNPVAGISAGTLPWTTRGGSARVDLTTGVGSFDVEGLVLNGGSATGTPGPITSVVGSLVCNPGG